MPPRYFYLISAALIILPGVFFLNPQPAQAGILDLITSVLFGQQSSQRSSQRSSQQPVGNGKPTLYTEPDHCAPCRHLEEELDKRYGRGWREYVNVSRGSPSGYIPYITYADGIEMIEEKFFIYLDGKMKRWGRQPLPVPMPPPKSKSPPLKPIPPDKKKDSPIPPGSTPWKPIPKKWGPASPTLFSLVIRAWQEASQENRSILYTEEIEVSADGKTLRFKFCELDENFKKKNCRFIEVVIPKVSDLDQYKKFVKALEDILKGGPIPPELKPQPATPPGKEGPPPPPSSSGGGETGLQAVTCRRRGDWFYCDDVKTGRPVVKYPAGSGQISFFIEEEIIKNPNAVFLYDPDKNQIIGPIPSELKPQPAPPPGKEGPPTQQGLPDPNKAPKPLSPFPVR